MRILLMGGSGSIILRRYIEHVLLDNGFEIHLATQCRSTETVEFCKKNNIKLVKSNEKVILLSRIPKLGRILDLVITIVQLYKKYDRFHVHYMDKASLLSAMILRKKCDKVIGTYWGSDLLRKSDDKLLGEKRFLKYFDIISLPTIGMKEKFLSIYNAEYKGRVSCVRFGVQGFEDIKGVLKHETKEECKEYFGFQREKVVIAIGYNGNKAQQHIKVIESLSKLPNDFLKELVLVFQMTYGGFTQEYQHEIISALEGLECDVKIFSEFMNDTDVARLRIAADIFVHAQISDALSASIQEYVYAGAVVLNPMWIKYIETEEIGIDIKEYSKFEEIADIVKEICDKGIKTNNENRMALEQLTSWSSVRKGWLMLYNGS